MGALFGSQKVDNSAQEAAKMQAQIAREQMAADERRFQAQQAQLAADKAAEEKRLQDAEAKRLKEIEDAKKAQAAQAEADRLTNAQASFQTTRTDQAKQLAGLPGFGNLTDKYKRAKQNNDASAGYMGQSNVLNPQGEVVFGGRKYTS